MVTGFVLFFSGQQYLNFILFHSAAWFFHSGCLEIHQKKNSLLGFQDISFHPSPFCWHFEFLLWFAFLFLLSAAKIVIYPNMMETKKTNAIYPQNPPSNVEAGNSSPLTWLCSVILDFTLGSLSSLRVKFCRQWQYSYMYGIISSMSLLTSFLIWILLVSAKSLADSQTLNHVSFAFFYITKLKHLENQY